MDDNNIFNGNAEEPISVKEWVITLLILAIPIVNLVMLFVWGFGDGTKKSKSNFAKATLIMFVIGAVLSIFFYASLMSLVLSLGRLY